VLLSFLFYLGLIDFSFGNYSTSTYFFQLNFILFNLFLITEKCFFWSITITKMVRASLDYELFKYAVILST